MKAVVEEVMGLRRGEGDEREVGFLAESGKRGGFVLALSALEANIYLLFISNAGGEKRQFITNNKMMRGR